MKVTNIYIISQIITIAYFAILSFSYLLKDRKRILTANFVAHIGQTTAMAMLKGYTGAAMAVIMMLRDLIFLVQEIKKSKDKEINKKFDLSILIMTVILIVVLTAFTYNGPLSLLSVIATLIATFALWQKNVKIYKILGVLVGIFWLSYNIVIMSIMGIILEAILGICSTIGYIRDIKQEKKEKETRPMYKMIIVDLDGTLLNDAKKVSKENADLIKRAYKEKGIITVIATGRPLGYAKEICELYGDYFANYIIAANGATIKDIKTNEYITNIAFTDEEVLALRNIYLEEKVNYLMAYTDEKVITETRDNKDIEDAGVSVSQKKTKVENIEEEIKNNSNIVKLCIMGGEISSLERIIEKINKLDGIETSVICSYLYKTEKSTFESKYIDINKSGCSKKNAIHTLADKLGIKQEEIIVMGDGGNDISMFECAGLKIAMANAEEYLKEKADYITTSNNESGVAKAIKKFVFNE